MQFTLTEDDQILQESLRRFSSETLTLPLASDEGRATDLTSLFDRLAEMGLWTLNLSAALGGSEMSLRSACLAIEAISRQHPSLATTLALRLGVINPVYAHLAPDFEINPNRPGARVLIQSSGESNYHLLGDDEEHLIFASNSGYGFSSLDDDLPLASDPPLGLRQLSQASLRPPVDLSPSSDLVAAAQLTTPLALCLASVAQGIAHSATQEALQYAGERSQFGKTLDRFQAIQFKLADMATWVDTSRWLLYRASTEERSALALASFDQAIAAALFCTDEALQIHGGYGYTTEYPVELLYRDALALSNLGQQLLAPHR